MKSMICLLAAGLLILPAWGHAAEKKDIHAVMTAEEGHDTAETAPAKSAPTGKDGSAESALNTEMDDLGEVSADGKDPDDSAAPVSDEASAAAVKDTKADKIGYGYGTDEPLSAREPVHRAAYAELTAIDPVTLKEGDWAFIEGDERRGWFFDRSRMTQNEDGSISYWQLILYNDLGREQFVRAMHDEAYETLGYTLQRRVLDLKENTIRTYEILAYDGTNTLITDGDRDGHAAEIRPNTMAEKERDAVKKAAKKLKRK